MMFLQNFIWADYFGRQSVGSIRGLANPINLVVGGLALPPPATCGTSGEPTIPRGGWEWRSWRSRRRSFSPHPRPPGASAAGRNRHHGRRR